MDKKRVGKFYVSEGFIEDSESGIREVMKRCVIVRAEYIWHKGLFEYIAFSDCFDPVPVGVAIPEYVWEFTMKEDVLFLSNVKRLKDPSEEDVAFVRELTKVKG
jgi:hypothetical protein